MDKKEILKQVQELLKFAKENPEQFEELVKGSAAPAMAPAPKPSASASKSATKAPAMKLPAIKAPSSRPSAPAMTKKERSAMVKAALKEDYKPKFKKCGDMKVNKGELDKDSSAVRQAAAKHPNAKANAMMTANPAVRQAALVHPNAKVDTTANPAVRQAAAKHPQVKKD